MRIGIEAHVVGARPTGNGRVVANLVTALADQTEHELFVYFTDRSVAEAWRARALERVTVRVVRPGMPFVRIPVALPLLAAKDRVDVFLAHDNSPPVAPCPVVTLLHDVAFERYPQFFSRYERAWMTRTIPASLRRSAGVLTVSEFTRDEIVHLYGIPAEKITVASNGVDPVFRDPTARIPIVEPPFFVVVGNLQPRKNLDVLFDALRALLDRHPEVRERLVVVGQKGFAGGALMQSARDLHSAGRVDFAGYVADPDLVGLLQHATAFAYPSVYEGFGLPPVEAMAAGTPTLVSDIAVMREVVAEAAIRIDPHSPEQWAEELWRVTVDADLRAKLATLGRERAARFTWEAAGLAAAGALERAAR
ncbi:MAG: glycosyltransferase family 4 protein [Actinomycetota bacterium]